MGNTTENKKKVIVKWSKLPAALGMRAAHEINNINVNILVIVKTTISKLHCWSRTKAAAVNSLVKHDRAEFAKRTLRWRRNSQFL